MARLPSIERQALPLSIPELLHPRNERVLVAAHRGAWTWAPENSLAAIDEAIAHGADIVECDVRATRDGVLVLMHDGTVDRMTDRLGRLEDMSWSELRRARLKARAGGADAPLTSSRPPTLSEALECARGRIVVNIDTKADALADRVAQAVVSSGMTDQVFVKAAVAGPADVASVRASPFFRHVPFVPMMKTRAGALVADLQRLESLGCPMFEVEFADISDLSSARPEFDRQQARLWVNTIDVSHSLDLNDRRALADPDAVWGALLQAGVGAIQTDTVEPLVAYLEARGRR
jgi:glycerophosphoryl diester phosphodiesterase